MTRIRVTKTMTLEFDLLDSYYEDGMSIEDKMEVERVSALQNEEYFKTVLPNDVFAESVDVEVVETSDDTEVTAGED